MKSGVPASVPFKIFVGSQYEHVVLKIIFNVYFVNQTLTLGSGIHGPGRTAPSGINRFRSLLRDFVRKITTLTDKLIEPDFKKWLLRGLFQIRTIVRDIFILNPKWRETVKTILINYQD